MKAIVQDTYGSPELLRLADIDKPVVGDDEVLVRVVASSVNRADWITVMGKPLLGRLWTGLLKPTDRTPGKDIAGRVEAVGKDVTLFQPGDEVFGQHLRAWAEYACVPEDRLALKPANLTFEQAAAVPLAGITALQGLRDKGRIRPGHQVLINGASGAVGTFAVQIAKALGAEVTGVCSTRNVDLLRSIGADHVIDYSRDDFARAGRSHDSIFDLAGSRSLTDYRRVLKPGGVYVSSTGGALHVLKALVASLFWKDVVVFHAWPTRKDLLVLKALIEAGKVCPVIEKRYELGEVPSALRQHGEGRARGKSVIAL